MCLLHWNLWRLIISYSKFSPGACSRSLVFLVFFQALIQLPVASHAQQGDVRRVHDPHIIKEAGSYYIFCTGPGIPIRRSTDLYNWKIVGRVFDKLPAWAKEEIPRAEFPWAPE